MTLQGFAAIDICQATALPGAGRLEYTPLDEVDVAAFQQAIENDTWNQQDAAGLVVWYALPYVQGSGSWTEEQQDSEQGVWFRQSVRATLAADSPAVRGELDRMKRRPFLLRLTRGGQVFLVGTPDMPLRFESQFDSGADSGDGRVHKVQWTGDCLQKSPGFVPVF